MTGPGVSHTSRNRRYGRLMETEVLVAERLLQYVHIPNVTFDDAYPVGNLCQILLPA